MIAVADVVAAFEFLALRFRWRWPLDLVGVDEALREAEVLAAGREEEEPAALLFALLRRPMDLGDAWAELPLTTAQNLIRKRGVMISLDARDPEVQALCMRVIARDPTRRATFDDVRAFLAERTRPLA